jgi:protein TonB
MKTRSTESFQWGTAIVISLLVHGLLLWQQDTMLYRTDGEQVKQHGFTRLSFRTLSKPVTPAITPQVIPEPTPIQPEKQSEPVPKPKPVRKIEKSATPHVTQQQRTPAPAPPVHQAVVTQETTTPPVSESPPAMIEPAGDSKAIAQARHNYLGDLAAHIESYKFYPRAARRRGIQGVIQVTFRLLENGSITDLEIKNGHKLLRSATEQALQKAQPLPRPPTTINTPLQISYGMEYLLK